MVGEITRSENVAAEGYELGRSAGHPDATLYYGILRFNVRFERGDLVDVANDVERIAAANPGVASLRATLALVYGETGQLDKARPLFEELVDQLGDIPQEASWPRAVAQAAMVCARLGDQRRAQVMLELLLPYRGQMICTGVSWVGAVAHYVGILEAVLGRFDDANASLVDAEAAHARVPAPTWLARTRLERARVLLARRAPGDADQARELLGKALDAARRYGLSSVERTVTALLDQTASVVP
jgi:tetratricopeptide (TPR) repeat protein